MKLLTLFIYFIILILSHALIAAQQLPINDFAQQVNAEKAKPGEEEA